MMFWVKRTTVNRPFSNVVVRCKGEETFNDPMITSQSFSEPVSLDCALHKCFFVLPHFVEQDG